MKKLFLSCIALLSIVLFWACGSEDGASAKAEGTYMTLRETNMVNLPPTIPFTPVKDRVTVKVKAVADDMVDVTIPSMTYKFNGTDMVIPVFTIHNLPVLDAGKEGVIIPIHDFKEKVDNKDVIGKIEVEIEPDGEFDMDLTFKYGSMPFGLKQEYESLRD